MADFPILDSGIVPGPSGPEKMLPGRIVSDDQYVIATLKAQGVAVVAFNPGTMTAPLTAFQRSSDPSSLIALLLAEGRL